ncbi:unnamed protein product [Ectocarpus sp. 12 AP-2014]
MRLVFINGIRTVMEAIDKIDPEFVEWGVERLVEAEDVSTAFKQEDIGGSDHLFGGTPRKEVGKEGEDILKIGVPIDAKQTGEADCDLSKVCKSHDIEGRGVVRWCMVMALVGREMLRKHSGGRVNGMFGSLQTTGEQMSPGVFGKVFREPGRSFFGMGNMGVNAMRTVQDTIAV